MPDTTLVGGLAAAVVLLIVVVALSRRKKAPAAEQPREIAPPAQAAPSLKPPVAAPQPASLAPAAPPPAAPEFPAPTAVVAEETPLVPVPPPAAHQQDEVEAAADEDASLGRAATEPPAPPVPTVPPTSAAPSSDRAQRPPMPSYSDISDESVAEEVRRSQVPEEVAAEEEAEPIESLAPPPVVKPAPRPVAPAFNKPVAPPAPKPVVPVAAAPAPAPPAPEPKAAAPAPAPTPKPAPSEPKVASAQLQSTAKVAPANILGAVARENEVAAPKPTAAAAAAARFLPPSNPATADLEKNDPRHAAARRLARLSVSEIKLYHETEVKEGREAKDLWKRLNKDISLARQTFDGRTPAEVRERFDYLYDEILRQLAEGDAAKLGPDAPAPKHEAAAVDSAVATPAAPAAAADAPADVVDFDAPTRTARRTLEPAAPEEVVSKPEPVAAPAPAPAPAAVAKPAPAPAPAPAAPAPAAAAPAAAPAAAAAKPTGLAARLAPSNPETAELEKNDPRHAAARRLARLSVSEIKLYHETEVKEGREAKDLWKRLNKDISLARQTFDGRTAADVRERFDYLYDEILRQLAEGDAAKLGPDAPKPTTAAAAPAAAAPAPAPSEPKPAPAPAPSEPKVAAAPAPAPTPKPAPSEPKAVPAPPPSEPKVAPAAAPAAASPAARFLPPSNPATADLEKNDPRHAAARRLARLSVSEIKLYHETEVKEGREAKDLWKRLNKDISLARQTFDGRTAADVRERFDYLYDEILRQLAEGDAAKLGADAPKPKVDA